LGGGWHNNHHRYGAGARAGLAWWEVDATYYILRLLSMLGIVWNLRPVPRQVFVDGGLISANTESLSSLELDKENGAN